MFIRYILISYIYYFTFNFKHISAQHPIHIQININQSFLHHDNPTSLNPFIENQNENVTNDIDIKLLAYHNEYEVIPMPCPPHHYCPLQQQNTSGTNPIIPCPQYSTTLATGASSIEDCIVQRNLCPTGTYFSQYEKAACTTCEPGFYCHETYRHQCPSNTYNPEYGQTQCIPCMKDGFWVTNNSTTCTLCPSGFMCIAGIPLPCPLDTFNPIYGATQCIPCPTGTYADPTIQAKTEVCQPCPFDHVCFDPSTIEPCPKNTVSPQGSTSLLNCMCQEEYECEFRKEVAVKLDITADQQLTFTEFKEIAGNLENDQQFIENLRSSYAVAMSLDVSQVLFKGLDIVT